MTTHGQKTQKDTAIKGAMTINGDFDRRATADTATMGWTASPEPGVARQMLDRQGGEVARATTIVRYDPGSRFSHHEHALGEEFLVLDGTFQDEHGVYPAGTYVRNPPGSGHAPGSEAGCRLFVKLRQFDPADLTRVVIDTKTATWQPAGHPGVTLLPLHQFGPERVALVRLAPGTAPPAHDHPGGEEIFVLAGSFDDEEGHYGTGAWLRNPPGSRHAAVSAEGCLLYVKAGHLAA